MTPPGTELKLPAGKFTYADVAGSYYFGDGLGVNCVLDLKPNGRFSFEWHGCLGVYDKNSGPYGFDGDMLIVHPEKPNRREGFQGMAERFYPIRWGKRLYMIADEQILGFASRVQRGWKGQESLGRSGFYYVRFDPAKGVNLDPDEELPGQPEFPAAYRQYLTKPFYANVIAVESKETYRVDKGSADGLIKGTMLGAQGIGWYHVESVYGHEATVRKWDKDEATLKEGVTLEPIEL